MGDGGGSTPSKSGLVGRVGAEILRRALRPSEAARQIGVGLDTLRKHLAGEHVRSDSALKYHDWLSGRPEGARHLFRRANERGGSTPAAPSTVHVPPPAAQPRLVVDIFAGCGGLSLGFDLLQGEHFQTVLALDHEAAPINVLNANSSRGGVGRVADLTEFLNGTEFLAYYLDHVARLNADAAVLGSLDTLHDGALPRFRAEIAAVDARYLQRLGVTRNTPDFCTAVAGIVRQSFDQTSVAAFHQTLRLPKLLSRALRLPDMLWSGSTPAETPIEAPPPDLLGQARLEWEVEVSGLGQKRSAAGRGQLGASGRRVAAFLDLVISDAFASVREAWIEWRASRLFLCTQTFGDGRIGLTLDELYRSSYPVSILVGGPPCQGFSRIGRGKIRSLREAQVQAHSSSAAGDARNLLFRQYVMILGALRPRAFVFENVQQFQATVRADDGDFQASEVLEEAIADMSQGRAHYAVTSQVLHAARYGIPQGRVRYFMCGIDSSVIGLPVARTLAESCLSLSESPEIPLSIALDGLGEPAFAGVDGGGRAPMRQPSSVSGPSGNVGDGYAAWIRQASPGRKRATGMTDAHVCRFAREDDARFFALMGPGRRWMDYRADQAETVSLLQSLLDSLLAAPKLSALRGLPSRTDLEDLRSRLNGALPLRLLLEQIQADLGYPHHLLRETYLSKRDSAHGDWLSRLDPERPSRTMVSHMAKDTYAFVHPTQARTLSVREAARVQTFPDWFSFGEATLTEAFRMIGNAVPPRLSVAIATRAAYALSITEGGDKGADVAAPPIHRLSLRSPQTT